MNRLDAVSSEYFPNAATSLENDLILHWYPRRITHRFGRCDSLLELGLGHGFTARCFSAHAERHVIIEGSPRVIELFRSNHPDSPARLVEGYFEDFDTDERFDVIVMGFILEHVDDPGLLLARYRRFLKPGGRMYVAVPNAKSMNRRLGLELGMIDDIYSLNANDIALGHQRQFCRDTLRGLLHEHGYQVLHEEGIYLKPLPLGVLKTLPDLEANLQAMLKVGIDFPDLCVGLLMEVQPV
ncbi:SAM-dependent methyltransferase [Cupriavidus sp. SK-3]|uniref:class I SAM-dependent methyltransferase n=1 Tax=Cupriavidus sp. SK-3 TaxID=1470558 RepID=UPI00044C797F|nr:class I SAM-dependent methyltransferase [Cupriavidus sp. SK-3]KDP86755.1 SAM-dependent methyltransferase [Cupriavidus sp. SK-3]